MQANAAYSNSDLEFSSGNTSIATVDAEGNISGKSKGYVTITVKAKYPNSMGQYMSVSTTYLDNAERTLMVPKDEYIRICQHFGLQAG